MTAVESRESVCTQEGMGPCLSRHPRDLPSYYNIEELPPAPTSGRFVAAIDFGSVFSGFGYGDRTKPSVMYIHAEWPGQSELSGQNPKAQGKSSSRAQLHRKTLTSLMYMTNVPSKRAGASPVDVATNWGWPAFLENQKRMAGEGFGARDGGQARYFTKFKLQFPSEVPVLPVATTVGPILYGKNNMIRMKATAAWCSGAKVSVLGSGLQAVDRQVSDYLKALGDFAISSARQAPGFTEISKKKVQWFLTVPAVWGPQTKERLKRCAQRAGLVAGPYCPQELWDAASPFSLILLLESEVACVSPQSILHGPGLQMLSKLQDGTDQVVVADIGAGSIDIATHAKHVQQGVCGLKLVKAEQRVLGIIALDNMFRDFLKRKYAFSVAMLKEYPEEVNMLMAAWEEVKHAFQGSPSDIFITLPPKLAELVPLAARGRIPKDWYGRIQLSREDLLQIFDPQVIRTVNMLKQEITPDVKKLVLVGGFSANPYFQTCVKIAFQERLKQELFIPDDPSTAILKGAVRVGLSPGVFSTKRNTLRWYGLRVGPRELLTCIETGQDIGHDFCFSQSFLPHQSGQKHMCFSIYTAQVFTRITSIDTPGVVPAAEFLMDISDDPENLDLDREVELRIYFCRANHVEVTAQRLNFGAEDQVIGFRLPVPSNLN